MAGQTSQADADLEGRLSGLTSSSLYLADSYCSAYADVPYIVCITHVKEPMAFEDASTSQSPSCSHDHPQSRTTESLSTPGISQTSSIDNAPRRRTRSATKEEQTSSRPAQTVQAKSQDTTLPEGIKAKIYRELSDLEEKARLGVRFVMVDQGMRIGACLSPRAVRRRLMMGFHRHIGT